MEQTHDNEHEVVPMLVEDPNSGSDSDESDDPFALFTSNWMMSRVNDQSSGYETILKTFAMGMGTAAGVTEIAAVHKNSFSGVFGKARSESSRAVMEAMKDRQGEKMNIRYAWYRGSLNKNNKFEIAEILSRGFSSLNGDEYGRIELVPMKRALDVAMALAAGDDGLRHMLLCRVVLGRMEVVADGSKQDGPSSDEFDSGVDSIVSPRRHFVWSQFMNSHIIPALVVSFKGPESLKGYVTTTSTKAVSVASPVIKRAGGPGRVTLPGLMVGLKRFLTPQEMKIIVRLYDDFKAKRISGEELKRKAKLIAGDDKLISAMKLMSSSVKMENESVRDIYLPGLINVLAEFLPAPKMAMLTKSLKEFRAKKMNRQELARSVRVIVGDDNVLVAAISAYRIGKERQVGKLIV